MPYAGWVADGIGYIRHSDFTEGCYEEMRAAIERLRTEKPLKGLVLDYRSNGGGIMQEAVKILGMFVPKGTEVVSTKGRSEDSKQVFRTDTEYISRFALTLYALGFIEDFGDEYTRRNPGRQIDIRTFSITDKDYADFAEFMQDKKVPYESDTRRALKALKKAAEDDRFADLKNKFEQVEAELKDDTQTNLETYRTQVVETINNDIVMRHGYQAGVIEHSLSGDKEVKKAVEVLGDPAEYARITREQDTKRK